MSGDSENSTFMSDADRALSLEFEQTAARYRWFLHSLSGSLRALLGFCDWWFLSPSGELELIIYCTSGNVRDRLMHRLLALSLQLERLFGPTQIRILGGCYPFETNTRQVITYYDYWKSREEGK